MLILQTSTKNKFSLKKYDWQDLIRRNLSVMRIMGQWPKEKSYSNNLYTCWAFFALIIFSFGFPFLRFIGAIFLTNDLEAFVDIIYVNFSEMISTMKAILIVKNIRILKKIMVTLESDLFQPKNQEQIALVQPAMKFWKINNVFYWTVAIGAVFFWCTQPVFSGLAEEQELPFASWYPVNTKISPYYEIVYVYQLIGISFAAFTSVCTVTLLSALNMYIGAQFDILCDNLRHLFFPGKRLAVNEFNKEFITCIKHHKLILKFSENSAKFSSWIILGQFFVSGSAIGLTMFLLTTVTTLDGDLFSLLSYLLSMFVEIFMYCWFGNEVEVKSSKIPLAIFQSNWPDAPKEIKQNVIIFMIRCQKPLKISALNVIYLSLDTFIRILRASWSYFTLLHQVTS